MQIKDVEKKDIDSAIAEYVTLINSDEGFKNRTIQYIEAKQQQISRFIEAGKSGVADPKYKLTVLRKWNSYTPVLPNENESLSNKGGGYFLRAADFGIVIDPGYNFVENFMNAGFKLDDIDCVFISHAHNDHTVELESIFSLLYKRNDKHTEEPVKKIKLFVNLGTFKKFAGYFDLSNPKDNYYIEDIVILNRHQSLVVNDSVSVFVADAKHHEMISRDYAVGFIFQINDDEENKLCTINFTCDTGWSTEFQEKNKDLAKDSLKKIEDDNGDVDVLVAHIGSIKEREFSYDCNKPLSENSDYLYTNHLGMIGCLASIFHWQPNLVLLSEFGQEMDAIREDIAKRFQEISKKNVIATDINFTLDLQCLEAMCFNDRNFYPIEDITTHPKDGQLYYINENNLNAQDALEIDRKLGRDIKVFSD
ncbi:MBL fold metallo-hydrolase [Desulfogranum marinum]|uniref:MBL fold metallo-hydrolase n=1 Tax=Desulfogranum marinum TaxID=453220 RepID=UPI0019660741|nr:MBL fold metallo-hydrolase [Desulfogranum marinum]MBM9514780.1 MBL fold metallo-hydrolase [Desulfogranum marinum]